MYVHTYMANKADSEPQVLCFVLLMGFIPVPRNDAPFLQLQPNNHTGCDVLMI